jgi:hypothetical protein
MDTTASRIIMAQKMPYTFFWTIFRKYLFSFQSGVVMEVLDTADTSYNHWKMLVTDIFITSVVSIQLYSTKTSGDKVIRWQKS